MKGAAALRPFLWCLASILNENGWGKYIVPRYNMRVARRAPQKDSQASQIDYWTLAELRYPIRRFLRLREVAARNAGIAPQQYLLLLQVKGLVGRGPATISTLAERLQLRHHSTVELIDRLAKLEMVDRRRASSDRREVQVVLKPRGEAVLRRLARYSVTELRTEGPALVSALNGLIGSRSMHAGRRRRHSDR